MTEHDEQVALFKWKRINIKTVPELEMLYSIPNGGHRHIGAAKKMKAEGQTRGVWDVALDAPKGGYHGLRIEMKVKGNYLTQEQKLFGERYEKYGYKAAVCYSWIEAVNVIENYLSI